LIVAAASSSRSQVFATAIIVMFLASLLTKRKALTATSQETKHPSERTQRTESKNVIDDG